MDIGQSTPDDCPPLVREPKLVRESTATRERELAREPDLVHEPEEPIETPAQREPDIIPEVLPIREEYPRPEPREKPPPALKEKETFGLLGWKRTFSSRVGKKNKEKNNALHSFAVWFPATGSLEFWLFEYKNPEKKPSERRRDQPQLLYSHNVI